MHDMTQARTDMAGPRYGFDTPTVPLAIAAGGVAALALGHPRVTQDSPTTRADKMGYRGPFWSHWRACLALN
jgi:hypothetical protein